MKYINNEVNHANRYARLSRRMLREPLRVRRGIRDCNAPFACLPAGRSLTGSNEGAIMVLVMIITAMIAAMAIAYVATTVSQQQVVDSSINNSDYEHAAMSGFEMTRAYLLSTYTPNTTGWDTQLTNNYANSTTYYAVSSVFPASNSINAGVNKSLFQWCRNIDYYGNTYFARIENNNDGGGATNDIDGVLKLTIEGWGGGNTQTARSQQILLEAMVSYKREPYAPTSALVVGGSLEMTGNPTITGTLGSVQSNGSVTVTGSSYVNGDVTAIGSVSAPPGSINGSSNPYSDETQIPPINPPDYKYLADRIFKTDGLVYDADNNLVATPVGWSYSGGTWSKGGAGGNTVNNGVFYFDGSNVDLGGSAGSSDNPMTLTLIATGYINVTGSPSLTPHPNGGGIGMMAGTVLRMRGAGGNVYGVGLYAAHEQVSLVGTPQIVGTVLAEDAADNSSLVSSVNNIDLFGTLTELAGNTLLTYNGGLTTVLTDGYPYIKILGFKKRIKARN